MRINVDRLTEKLYSEMLKVADPGANLPESREAIAKHAALIASSVAEEFKTPEPLMLEIINFTVASEVCVCNAAGNVCLQGAVMDGALEVVFATLPRELCPTSTKIFPV